MPQNQHLPLAKHFNIAQPVQFRHLVEEKRKYRELQFRTCMYVVLCSGHFYHRVNTMRVGRKPVQAHVRQMDGQIPDPEQQQLTEWSHPTQ